MPNAYAELIQSDLDKIDQLIQSSEKRMKEYVDLKINSSVNEIKLIVKQEIETAIHASEKRMKHYVDSQIIHLDKSINRNFLLILALIGFVTVVVGVPQIIVIFQNKQFNSMSNEIESIKEIVENLTNQK